MVKHLENEQEFNELIKGRILVDFYADWCGSCIRQAPLVENLKEIDVLKVNVDLFDSFSWSYGIMSIPTLILFDSGSEVKKTIGFKTKEELLEFIK